MPATQLTGIVLAGGHSRRLGVDKTTMPWPPKEYASALGADLLKSRCDDDTGAVQHQLAAVPRTLLGTTAHALAQVCDEVIVVGYRGARVLPDHVVPDLYAGGGSLGGLYSGLTAAATEFALAVATDMPFLCVPLLRWMTSQPRDYDALVPLRDEPEPLHAIYSKRCLEPMRRRLESSQLKIADLYDDVRVRYVERATLDRFDPEGLSFFNVNTPEDLERALAILARRDGAVDLTPPSR